MKIRLHFSLALGILGLGFLYYYLLRNPTIVQEALGFGSLAIVWEYSKYLNWFPSFAHQFSFSIFTWILLGRTRRYFSILSWMIINISAELIQGIPSEIAKSISSSLEFYVSRSTFAIEDIVAILVASIAAWIITGIQYKNF